MKLLNNLKNSPKRSGLKQQQIITSHDLLGWPGGSSAVICLGSVTKLHSTGGRLWSELS